MRRISYIDATTPEDVISALSKGDAAINAGGTDLINLLKARSLPAPPKTIVNIKNITGLNYIKEDGSGLKIGALTRLCDIEENRVIQEKYPLLSMAARAVASPQIRNMGTIAGNICQDTRCWYYRYTENVFHCLRKGGEKCYALTGENRFHSIYGATRVSDPPCRLNCPGGVGIPMYLSRLRDGNLDEAAEILLEHNPIPAITGRVCPHFCQDECNRNDFDESVSVRNIERFLGDYILDNAETLIRPPTEETDFKIAVIGAGPAGISAAYYLRKLGHKVTVFDRMKDAGGMLAYTIPAYRLPRDLVKRVTKALENIGVQFKLKVNVGKDITLESLRKDFDGVFLGTGAWDQPSIMIEGEHLTESGIDFLTDWKGKRNQVKGKKVVVIGGGNVAVDVGITARRLGAAEVTLACLESREEMPAFEREIEQAVEEGIRIMPSWGPSKILEEDGTVKGARLVRCASVFDEEGTFCPTLDDSVSEIVEADYILMAVGQTTDLSSLGPDSSLKAERGLIVIDGITQETSIPGIFAGGDVTTGPASVIQAIASGRMAAEAIDRRLRGEGSRPAEAAPGTGEPLLSFNTDCLKESSAASLPKLPPDKRGLDTEDALGLEWEQVLKEAGRCFNCGCIAVSPSDMAPALIALDARIKTTKRTINAEDFFSVSIMRSTVLDDDEYVTGIEIPALKKGGKQAFLKFRMRKTIDFPVVSVASVLTLDSGKVQQARIALSGVAPIPWRSGDAEAAIMGKPVTEKSAEDAAEAAVAGAHPLPQNGYLIQIVKTLVKRALLAGDNHTG